MNGSRDAWIEVPDRIAAVALMQRLARRGSYLIQRTQDRWVVYAQCDETAFEKVVAEVQASPHRAPVTVHWRDRRVVLPAHNGAPAAV